MFSRPIIKIGTGVVFAALLAGGGWWYVQTNQAPAFRALVATQGNVVSSLSEPVSVLSDNDVDLSFQEAGQIASVPVVSGQEVSAGTLLASLDTSSLQVGLDQASSVLATAEANLAQLTSGTRPQQITIDETAVSNAQAALDAEMGTAYAVADDAIHNQTDNLFANPMTIDDPVFLLPVNDSQMLNNIQRQRTLIGTAMDQWYAEQNASSSSPSALLGTTNSILQQIQSYVDMLALVTNDATPSSVQPASVLAGYRANVVTARTEVDGVITALVGATATLKSAQDALALAEAGATPQSIEAQQAVVAQAQAQVAGAQVALAHADLTAPFSGAVRNLTARVGQVVSPGVPVVSLTDPIGLKIDTYVSEADVARVQIGDTANVALDAYGAGTVFPATVTSIDSAATVVNGTPMYKVTLHFTKNDGRAKDGMTGNVQIILAEHVGVVEVPSRLVINDGSKNYVMVQSGSGIERRQVQIGLVGDNGMTEIVSGVAAGEKLVNF